MKTFTKKFESATFSADVYENGSARWSMTFANGKKKLSYRLFDSVDEAKEAVVEHYIPECQKRLDQNERIWAIYDFISPKTGKPRAVFLP